MTKLKKLNSDQIRGFFEGDGGFLFRVDTDSGKRLNSYGFRVQAKFGQKTKNTEVLDLVKNSLGLDSTITTYESVTKKGTKTSNNSLVIELNSKDGKKFLELYKNVTPLNPGTYRNFLIGLLINDIVQTQTLPLSEPLLKRFSEKTSIDRSRCLTLTCLWLREQRTTINDQADTFEDYHKKFRATSSEIAEAKLFGESLYGSINDKVSALVADLEKEKIQINEDYIAYYHVADGCFTVTVRPRDNVEGKDSLQITPEWNISDDEDAIPLLKAIIKQLKLKRAVGINKTDNTYTLKAVGFKVANSVVLPFFSDKELPEFRQKQFELFRDLCETYESYARLYGPGPYRKMPADVFRNFVRTAYFLNTNSSSVRSEDKYDINIAPVVEAYIRKHKLK